MRAGEFPDGAHVLRLKIDMGSPNVNMRDPAIYRIRHASHHRTGDTWCIYPLYDYTHCISDALERITHSICTLEFQDHRPLYDWVIEKLADGGMLERPLPQQYEFARLNLTYVVLSKRRLIELVEKGFVDGWDDPRMPTLVGARRRGFTPEGFRLLAERIGVSKADSWIDMSVLEDCMRDDLNARAQRRIAVLDPVKLVIDNYPEGQSEDCFAPNHPQRPELGKRALPLTRELWIERDDYTEAPPKGYFRLTPGAEVRLRYGYIVKCTGAEKDAAGNVTEVHCTYDPDTRSGTPGADARKVKGNIHWLSAAHAVPAEVRIYDRLFAVPFPGRAQSVGQRARRAAADEPAPAHHAVVAGDEDDGVDVVERNYLDDLNPDSKRVHPRVRRAGARRGRARGALPVRAPRLLRRRPRRSRAGRAGVQPRGDAQGFLVQVGRVRRLALRRNAAFARRSRKRCAAPIFRQRSARWRACAKMAPRHRSRTEVLHETHRPVPRDQPRGHRSCCRSC